MTVIVQVSGGNAEATHVPEGSTVVIVDWDNLLGRGDRGSAFGYVVGQLTDELTKENPDADRVRELMDALEGG